jgi:AraC-like DNA-binding protein
MRTGQDTAVRFPGFYLVHHNLPGKTVGTHQWPQHVFFIPLQGEIRINLADSTLAAGPGKIIYLPPRQVMRFESSKLAGDRLICMIDNSRWKAETNLKSEPSIFPAHQLAKEILFYLLLNPGLRSARSLVSTLVHVLAESLESAAHTTLLRVAHVDSKLSDPRIGKALQILRRDHATPLRIGTVAKEAGASVRTLSRLFLTHLGLSPKQALIHFRIEAAQELLLAGNSVTSSARACGYDSPAQFIAAFRRLTGQLPSEVIRFGRKQ